jgi:hypothetical protein
MVLGRAVVAPILAAVLATGFGASGAGADQVAVPPGMRLEPIRDKGLQMDAYSVLVPADWHFQGAVVYGTACDPSAFPVFRVTSPDGLTMLERLPRLFWRWGMLTTKGKNQGCLAIDREMSAAEFLQRFSAHLQVEYVGDRPLLPEELEGPRRADAAANANSGPNVQQQTQVAAARVRYRNGTFPMEAELKLFLSCVRHAPVGRNPRWESCEATVRAVRAPEGKLEEMTKKLALAGVRGSNPQWEQAYYRLQMQQMQAAAQQAAQLNQLTTQNMQAQNQQFNQAMALQQQQHQQFMQQMNNQQATHQQAIDTMQRGTNMSMQQANQASAARHTATSDMVDYALGQQTVRDPSTGQVNKVAGGYTNTWVDSTGRQSFQTGDTNANPNGVLQGTWNLQQQVHGDGTGK